MQQLFSRIKGTQAAMDAFVSINADNVSPAELLDRNPSARLLAAEGTPASNRDRPAYRPGPRLPITRRSAASRKPIHPVTQCEHHRGAAHASRSR
jgi:hypothetical protein